MAQNRVADRMNLLHTESAFSIMQRANALEAQGKSVVHLEIGQPDFKTPRNVIDAACRALNEGKTGYTPTAGIPPLREAIAKHCRDYKNVEVEMEEVVVVPGGKPVMFYTLLMLAQSGDEVIYPNPGFPIYESVIKFSGAKPVPMPLLEEKNFRVDLERLRRDINSKTKLIIVNNPSNPTGGVLSREDITAIADMVRGKGIYVMSDEIYDRIIFGEKPVSIAAMPGMKDWTIILDGFSKTFAMTGWRLGFGVMNKELAAHMTMLMANSNSCSASMTQWAAIEALQGPQESVREMVAAFKERRDYLIGALNAIDGVHCVLPEGAFYAFPNISSFGLTSARFADRLLEEGGVAAAGGTAFGEFGEGFIRLSYANSLENLKIAVDRIAKFTQTLAK
ncbi:MAG: pyridoxal phosphate-dependent aminotransferase [Synergistaceae bacterium]|nr:pyridoxal phosphate-dependent aminotransferase [Synergistaceae bacterium]